MQGQDFIGWGASFILVLTLGRQVFEQWKKGSSRDVSPWLFVGQLAASIGFSIYSYLVRNWVFVVTNSILVVNAVLGQLIVLQHRRRARRARHEQASDEGELPGRSAA